MNCRNYKELGLVEVRALERGERELGFLKKGTRLVLSESGPRSGSFPLSASNKEEENY